MADPAPFLYLATPCHGGRVNLQFMRSVLALQTACAERGIGLEADLLEGDHLIARARSRLAARFLAHPSATHLLFCDADIGFAPENVFRLLASGRPVVGGVYPMKHLDWTKVRRAARAGVEDVQAASMGYVVRFLPSATNSIEVEDGFAEVAYVGAGFLMIARSVLQRVVEAHPELRVRLDDGEAVMMFDTEIEPGTGQHLSEDYAFLARWRALGGKVFADVEAPLMHVGPAVYKGSLLAALQAEARMRAG